jgi:nucleoside phosphorylase
MKILVTFAVEAEFAPWRKIRPFKELLVNSRHYSGGVDAFEAQIGGNTVWVFLTGMGIKCFDFEVAACFRDAGVNLILSSGLAGSLSPECRQSEIIAPMRVGNLRDANGVPSDPRITALAKRYGATPIGTLITADHIVETAHEKKRLGQFGEAVDMESFHVVSHFLQDDVPAAVVRAISDDSEQDLPVDFARCLTSDGRVRVGALAKELLATPAKVPALLKFGRQSRAAAQKMAVFLDGLIEKLTPEIVAAEDAEVTAR